jgi:hypothetical protein
MFNVQWEGLTKTILDFQETIPQNASRAIADMTEDLFETTLLRYIENLSGGSPSTDEAPLPVGIESGDLLGHAWSDSQLTNQYAFELKNNSDHAAYIEFGTSKMAPRAPLQDAVDVLERETGQRLEDVTREIMTGV